MHTIVRLVKDTYMCCMMCCFRRYYVMPCLCASDF